VTQRTTTVSVGLFVAGKVELWTVNTDGSGLSKLTRTRSLAQYAWGPHPLGALRAALARSEWRDLGGKVDWARTPSRDPFLRRQVLLTSTGY
jgi:hypothetical protein